MAIGVTTAYVVYQVKDTIFWIENRRASRGATLNRTPTSYVLIEGVTWSDTLNTILPLKAIIQIKPIERVAYANESGRDFKSHSDFVSFYWGRHSKWHPQ